MKPIFKRLFAWIQKRLTAIVLGLSMRDLQTVIGAVQRADGPAYDGHAGSAREELVLSMVKATLNHLTPDQRKLAVRAAYVLTRLFPSLATPK